MAAPSKPLQMDGLTFMRAAPLFCRSQDVSRMYDDVDDLDDALKASSTCSTQVRGNQGWLLAPRTTTTRPEEHATESA